MADSGKEMLATQCDLRDILKQLDDMYEKSKALCEAACQHVKDIENLKISLCQKVKLVEDQLNEYSHTETQAVDGSERVDSGTGSLMAKHPRAGFAGNDHEEPLGNGVTQLPASDARQIAENLDSSDPVKTSTKTNPSLAPTGHEVSPVEVAPLPGEGATLSDGGVDVVLEENETDHVPIQVMDEIDDFPVQIMDETNHFPIQVSDPLPRESYSFSALRLTEEAIARLATCATGQPIPISRADVIVEFVEINIFRQV